MQTQSFLDIFSGCIADEHLRRVVEPVQVRSVSIEKEKRSISIILDRALPEELLEAVKTAIGQAFGLHAVQVEQAPLPGGRQEESPMEETEGCAPDVPWEEDPVAAQGHEEMPPQDVPEEAGQTQSDTRLHAIRTVFERLFPPASGFLREATVREEEGSLVLTVPEAGLPLMKPYLAQVTQALLEETGQKEILVLEPAAQEQRQSLLEKQEAFRKQKLGEAPAIRIKPKSKQSKRAILGRIPTQKPVEIGTLELDMGRVTVSGRVFSVQHRELKKRGAWVVSFDMTDNTGSIRVSKFMLSEEARSVVDGVKKGGYVSVQGQLSLSRYENDMIMEPQNIAPGEAPAVRLDTAQQARVELHLHTRYSTMDALTDVAAVIDRAHTWGHKAIAITDHGALQAFPDAASAAKGKDIKILYGVEAYFIDDTESARAVRGKCNIPLNGEFICFDLETTGLYPGRDAITEIGAVLLKNGEITDRFQTFVDPQRPIPAEIVQLTGITDQMVRGAPKIREAMEAFLAFVGDRPLAAHNASFDISFVGEACRNLDLPFVPTSIDTLILSRQLLPKLNRHKLDVVAKHLHLPAFSHHRASDDAATAALILSHFFDMLKDRGVADLGAVNGYLEKHQASKRRLDGSPRHITILVQNQTGLRNLYKLVSLSHLEYFKRVPIIPRSLLDENREGLLLGSACERGAVFSAVLAGQNRQALLDIASYYDFLEIMPLSNNMFLLREGKCDSEEGLREFNRTIYQLGKSLNLPVAATGDVHFLDPEDEEFRRILLASKKFKDADQPQPLYFRTTQEMLLEFSYLGEAAAHEVVVQAPNQIADLCETVSPLPKGLFAPTLDGAEEELNSLVWGKAKELYGDPVPELISQRIETELNDIIGCNYAVIYMSAQKLVEKSLEDGYLVGSRGSVGSSLVAFLAGITEVNALPPHYRCPDCKHTEFDEEGIYGCGADMPDVNCPNCGALYAKDGFQIPFETFLGFGGDKVPDIDLNFSGEYQAKAHKHTFALFGENHVFRAGTIGTVAEKTAFGYVKKYLEERGRSTSAAEENRLSQGCVGVKRTTGQHPGGLVVIPRDKEIYDFCPVQRPADDPGTDIVTTHFEYHAMESNLLKLDLLGHDDPTMIRMLQDLTGVNPQTIPLDDPDTMSLFVSSKALGFENDRVLGPTGACAIPEFGTRFVRGMLQDTNPTRFDTLVRISGFSHGTDVWLGNARDYILSGTATVDEVIGCRDDIMLYLIRLGMDERLAFKIMEAVRKNKPILPEWEQAMQEIKVPQWYIDSCHKIQYLFPKAHAVAYVMMAFRIAWFKVHRPLAFYAAYFTIRAKAFDAFYMTRGMEVIKGKLRELEQKADRSSVEEDMMVTLEVCYEMYLRGFSFSPVDIYRSQATEFVIEGSALLPPFIAVPGLGETAAKDIVAHRTGEEFLSVEEFSQLCQKVTKGHVEQLKELGVFEGIPNTSQLSLF